MGNNNVACFLRQRGSFPFPSHIQLGTDATINMKTYISHSSVDGDYTEKAEVLYTVEGSKCKLGLERSICNGHINFLSFLLHDSIICSDKKGLRLPIIKMGTDFLCLSFAFQCSIPWTKTRKNVDAWGGVTNTNVYLYGTANRCGLLVLEGKKNNYNSNSYNASCIAHYFVSSKGSVAVNRSSETTDIGFSVVTKVGISDDKFDITVEGPDPHPVSALLYMFDEVNRTGIWKSNMCPHCRNIQREHSRMFLQSDSEDNHDGRRQNAVSIENTGSFRGSGCGARVGRDLYVINNLREDNNDVPLSEDDVVPFPPRFGRQRNAATIANYGGHRGNVNGNIIRCQNFYGYN